MDLRVGELPEEEVGDADLSARADGQLERRQAARPETVLDGFGVDVVGQQRAAPGVFRHLAGHGDDLLASAVAQREGEHHVFSLGARRAQLLERIAHAGRQAIELADGVEPDAVVEDLAALAFEVVAEQIHETAHFFRGAIPGLRGEGVERERGQAELAGGAGDRANAVRALAVAFEPGKGAHLRPASVAVHDDADVARQRPSRNLTAQVRELELGAHVAPSFGSRRPRTVAPPICSGQETGEKVG